MLSVAKRFARRALEGQGYQLFAKGALGHNPWIDIKTLAGRWGWSIETVVDVGANDGGTIRDIRRHFPSASIHAFEPSPDTFEILRQRVGADVHTKLVCSALGADVGRASLHVYEASVVNSLVPDANFISRFPQEAQTLEVAVDTLDRYCEAEGIATVDVLKIDTEGYEVEVLTGALGLMARGALGFVYAEFNDLRTSTGRGALVALDDLLRPQAFRFVATYNDYVVHEGEFFAVSNALFVRPPQPVNWRASDAEEGKTGAAA